MLGFVVTCSDGTGRGPAAGSDTARGHKAITPATASTTTTTVHRSSERITPTGPDRARPDRARPDRARPGPDDARPDDAQLLPRPR